MNTLLLIYAIVSKITLTGLFWYIAKLRKRLKEKHKGPIGYVCQTDYQHELSWGQPGVGVGSYVTVYDSLKGVMKKECAVECGVYKVMLVKVDTPIPSKIPGLKS
jgi:hypothetical protein